MLSAKWALSGKINGHEGKVKASGIDKLQTYLVELLKNERQSIRLKRFEAVYRGICGQIYNRLRNRKIIVGNDLAAMEKSYRELMVLTEKSTDGEKIRAYAAKNEQNICQITEKSLQHFYYKLHDDATNMIMDYRGSDFKNFVESRIQRLVQREIDNWLGMYSPRINMMVEKMKKEMAGAISRQLKNRLNLQTDIYAERLGINPGYRLNLESKDVSNTDVKSGAVVAAGGIGMGLIVGDFIMPLLSFAAMPLIRRHMLERELNEAKSILLPELENQLVSCFEELLSDIKEKIHLLVEKAVYEVESAYAAVLDEYRIELEHEMQQQESDRARHVAEERKLMLAIEDLRKYLLI